MFVIITSCSSRKDDSIPVPDNSKVVEPSYYLDQDKIPYLLRIRKRVYEDPRACIGAKVTYAFDLYVRAGKAYKDLFNKNYYQTRFLLLSGGIIEWFFLSGLYGIVHALEKARNYCATFNRMISYKNGIPFTANLWENILPLVCNNVLSRYHPDGVYIFGSQDYAEFIKRTEYYKSSNKIKIFESTGSSGPSWLSPILNELVLSILDNDLISFNSKYGRFTKQNLVTKRPRRDS